jgi:hypothetical protein
MTNIVIKLGQETSTNWVDRRGKCTDGGGVFSIHLSRRAESAIASPPCERGKQLRAYRRNSAKIPTSCVSPNLVETQRSYNKEDKLVKMKVTIKEWNAVATWRWDMPEDDVCGICRVQFDGTCPTCKFPGDDCSLCEFCSCSTLVMGQNANLQLYVLQCSENAATLSIWCDCGSFRPHSMEPLTRSLS